MTTIHYDTLLQWLQDRAKQEIEKSNFWVDRSKAMAIRHNGLADAFQEAAIFVVTKAEEAVKGGA